VMKLVRLLTDSNEASRGHLQEKCREGPKYPREEEKNSRGRPNNSRKKKGLLQSAQINEKKCIRKSTVLERGVKQKKGEEWEELFPWGRK